MSKLNDDLSTERVTLGDIEAAYETIKGSIKKTTMVKCPVLEEMTGNRIYFKLENLQKTGSFKVRGALNKITNLTEEEKKNGVIASSAGNHAQGVALGATAMGIESTIVMPATAPLAKVLATKNYGGKVVLHGSVYDDAYAKACEIQKESGATFLHPFDDKYVIAGQGTIGLEILEDLEEVDIVVVPIGGGGIISGIATAIKAIKPSVRVIGVEAANAASMKAALEKGEVHTIEATPTIADGIAVKRAGNLTYEIIKENVDEIVTVSESEISEAFLFLMEKSKVVAEGAGAVSVAAVMSNKIDAKDKNIVSVISGGNVDINLMERIINRALLKVGRRYGFKVRIPDKAGELEKMLKLIASLNANILQLFQTMYREDLDISMQEVEIVLECFDIKHREEVRKALAKENYIVF